MAKTIRHSPKNSDFQEVVMVDRIVYLSKFTGDITMIHLDTGDILYSRESMNTLQARIDLSTGR